MKPIDAPALARSLANAHAGACVTFEGWVRDHNDGRSVQRLDYQAYAPLAQSEGERILADATRALRASSMRVACIASGQLAIGDLAVWVGVSAAHRDAAFDGLPLHHRRGETARADLEE